MNEGPWRVLGWMLVAIVAVVFSPILIPVAIVYAIGSIAVPLAVVAALLAGLLIFEPFGRGIILDIVLWAAIAIIMIGLLCAIWARAERRRPRRDRKLSSPQSQ